MTPKTRTVMLLIAALPLFAKITLSIIGLFIILAVCSIVSSGDSDEVYKRDYQDYLKRKSPEKKLPTITKLKIDLADLGADASLSTSFG